MAVHVHNNDCARALILGTFLRRSRQDENVKWPNFVLSGESTPQRLTF